MDELIKERALEEARAHAIGEWRDATRRWLDPSMPFALPQKEREVRSWACARIAEDLEKMAVLRPLLDDLADRVLDEECKMLGVHERARAVVEAWRAT